VQTRSFSLCLCKRTKKPYFFFFKKNADLYCRWIYFITLDRNIAAECNAKTMCLNCKEHGHFANECSNDHICHLCNKVGHLARECSASGASVHDQRICNNCFKPGHFAAECNNDKACNNCCKPGHLARECPNDPVCNVSGHLARQCPKSNLPSERVGGPFRDIICRN
ncbi:hypothetical protein MKX01_037457, partial [Papaver californicum]